MSQPSFAIGPVAVAARGGDAFVLQRPCPIGTPLLHLRVAPAGGRRQVTVALTPADAIALAGELERMARAITEADEARPAG